MTKWDVIRNYKKELVPQLLLAFAKAYPTEEALSNELFRELTEFELQLMRDVAQTEEGASIRCLFPEYNNDTH